MPLAIAMMRRFRYAPHCFAHAKVPTPKNSTSPCPGDLKEAKGQSMKTSPSHSLLLALVFITTPAAAQTFEGPYAGVEAGWSQNKVGDLPTEVGRAAIGSSRDAFETGIFAGYNHHVADAVVLGAEAGFNIGFKDNVSGRSAAGAFASIDPETSFNISARAGYVLGEDTLLYVRGGYENVHGSVRVVDKVGSTYSKDSFDGWSVGGGVERAITERVSARFEYRYSDLGSDGGKFERQQALAGIAYHF
jgi:outer membrane immunogenic protein